MHKRTKMAKRMTRLRGASAPLFALATLMLGGSYAMAQAAPQAGNAAPGKGAKRMKPENLAQDIKADALWDGRGIVPFHAIDNPKMVTAKDADFLDDNDYVLGLTSKGENRAYPTRFIWWHHIVNDTVGGVPVAISYCSVCNTGIAFDPKVDGKPIKIDFYGLYNGVVCLCERETQGVLLQVDGRIVSGPLQGKTLPMRSLLDTTWGKWKKLHPDTLVMSPDTEYAKGYRPRGTAEPRGYDHFPMPVFAPTVTRGDKRLPAFEKVLAVTLPAEAGRRGSERHRAYPVKALQEAGSVLNDKVGTTFVAVLFDPATTTAVAVGRVVEGKTLTFEAHAADGVTTFYDKETGTRWSIEGKGEAGPLAGKTLPVLDNHLSQWYGWAAYFPDTTIYGRSDLPQPFDPLTAPAQSETSALNSAPSKP